MALAVRRFSTLIALLVAAAALVPAADSRVSVLPTLYVDYTMSCTFTILDDSGKKVTSIAPGTYQVQVQTPVTFGAVDLSGITDMTACQSFVQFQLTGPGVNLSTTLGDGDSAFALLPGTAFQANATYTAVDLNQPSVARVAFTTAATGSATGPAGTATSSSSKSSASKGSSQPSLVGSAVVPFRGLLAGSIDTGGALALKTKGKPVGTLKSGLYTFTVHDDSVKSGFSIQKLKASAIALTGAAYKGTHVKTVQLKAGQWTFFSPGGRKNYFIVVN
jgi:hypothetical protein